MEITQDQKLQAFALYTMAKHHNAESERYYEAILRVFGTNRRDDGHVSDAVFGYHSLGGPHEFDELLKRMKITVLPGEGADGKP